MSVNVTVAEQNKLKRKLSVEVPLDEVRAAYEGVFSQLRSNLRVDGFRPGKFPRALAEKRFKDVMAGEALQTLVPRYFDQALKQLNLKPSTEPSFDNLDIDKNKPFRFDVEFEVVPDFELLATNAFSLKEPKVTVAKKDVDQRLESLRRSRATMEDKGAESAAGDDVVTFDFEGTMGGAPFPGGSAKGQRLDLAESGYLPDFQKQFSGITAGQEKQFPLTFPEDYGQASLAGKEVSFTVKATKVERRVLPPLDKSFFAQLGEFEDEKGFRTHLEQQLKEEKLTEKEQELRNEISEQIRSKYTFDVPETLIRQMLEDYQRELTQRDPSAVLDEKKFNELSQAETLRIEGNLRLTYVIDRLGKEYGIEADPDEVRQRFFMQAYMMQQNPTELLRSDFGQRMLYQIQQAQMAGLVLGHVVDLVLGRPPKPVTPKGDAAALAAPGPSHEHAHDHADGHKHDHAHDHTHDHTHDHSHDAAHDHEHGKGKGQGRRSGKK